jgi:LDH2 family malate/lactate/ureidoglycolate dehydrogenase
MMYAQLRGNNQGIIKITTGGMNRSKGAGPITIERDTRLSAVLNGKGDAGMLVLSKAAEMATKKCREHGFGVVGTNHTSTSTGCLAYYAEKIARQRYIGVVLAQSPEFVAPAGAHFITVNAMLLLLHKQQLRFFIALSILRCVLLFTI